MSCGCGDSRKKVEYPWYAQSVAAAAPSGVLSGKRIVTLTTILAAPAAGAILSDLGAEVIKIEEPGGDPMRRLLLAAQRNRGAVNAPCTMFEYANRGVQSVTLNLKTAEGQEDLKNLLKTADAFVTNTRVPLLKAWGLDYEALTASHPKLIYSHFTAWGRSGPMVEEIGYDVAAFNASLGMMKFMAHPEDTMMPRYPTGLGDFCCSIGLAAGTVLALLERDWTQSGQLAELSLLSGAAWCMSGSLVSLQAGSKASNAGALLDSLVPGASWGNKAFRTSDKEWLAFSCIDTSEQPRALRALGIDSAPAGAEAAVAEAIASRSLEENMSLLRAKGVEWCSGAAVMEDTVKSEMYNSLAVGLPQMDDCQHVIRQPVSFGSHEHRPTRRAPPLGFHNSEVLGPLSEVIAQEPAVPDERAPPKNARGAVVRSFADLRVVELGASVAAAAGGVQLAELGLEVVKVEPKGGDPARNLSIPSMFEHLNRGKRSVELDLSDAQKQLQLKRLVQSADVFLVSLPLADLRAVGLDWETLRKESPGLIFVHVSPSGYGKPGWHGLGAEFVPFYISGAALFDNCRPIARLPFADDDSPPPQLVPFWGEHATSFQVILGVAGALTHRLRGGPGQKVEVTLESTPFFFAGGNTMVLQHGKTINGIDYFDDPKHQFPFKHIGIDKNGLRTLGGVVIVGLQAYKCKDGLWVQLLEMELFSPLGKIIDALDSATSGKTKRNAIWNAIFYSGPPMDRICLYLGTYRQAVWELIQTMSRKDVEERLKAGKIRHILVGDMVESEHHVQVQHLGLLQEGVVRAPITLRGGASRAARASAPSLGQDSIDALLS